MAGGAHTDTHTASKLYPGGIVPFSAISARVSSASSSSRVLRLPSPTPARAETLPVLPTTRSPPPPHHRTMQSAKQASALAQETSGRSISAAPRALPKAARRAAAVSAALHHHRQAPLAGDPPRHSPVASCSSRAPPSPPAPARSLYARGSRARMATPPAAFLGLNGGASPPQPPYNVVITGSTKGVCAGRR